MSVPEAARRLELVIGGALCRGCPDAIGQHRQDCPYRALPQIVAALEAAEQLIVDFECDPKQRVDGWRLSISMPNLRAALRGEPA